jgi:hypothetical protein
MLFREPRPEFIDIPSLHHEEPSYVVVYTTEPGEAIVFELDLVLGRKHEVIGQRYASITGLNKETKQKDTARQSRNHKQEDQSQPNGISCTQRTLRNAEETKL